MRIKNSKDFGKVHPSVDGTYDLRNANCENANLPDTDFGWDNCKGASFRNANLTDCNFEGADLRGCDFRGADLSNCNFEGAKTKGAKLPGSLVKLPQREESFICWKKVREGVVLKLEVLKNSPRVSTPIGDKCRAKKVRVLEAFDSDGKQSKKKIFYSLHDRNFKHEIGEVVKVKDYDGNRLVECTRGIHFYMEREKAEAYY
jgi:hypothetical protein